MNALSNAKKTDSLEDFLSVSEEHIVFSVIEQIAFRVTNVPSSNWHTVRMIENAQKLAEYKIKVLQILRHASTKENAGMQKEITLLLTDGWQKHQQEIGHLFGNLLGICQMLPDDFFT